MTTRGSRRLLMLGLDGGDLELIRQWSTELPFLRRAVGEWQLFEPSAPQALSGSVWPTFYNGQHPGVHGLYQHLVWDPSRMGLRRIGPDWCYYKPFWADLEQRGHSVVVLDVPYSFPVSLRRGIEITDWGTHGQTWPLGCNDERARAILRRAGRSPMGRETPVRKSPRQLEAIRRRMIRSADQKASLVGELTKELEWDAFLVVFGETHRAGHVLFDQGDTEEGAVALRDVYRAADRALARVVAEAASDETIVMIFSVHGMAADYAQGHFVPILMRRINELFMKRQGRNDADPSSPGWISRLRRAVPAGMQPAVGSAVSDSVRQWVVEKEIVGGLNWDHTPGFALRSDIRTEIRLNLEGRESRGILAPEGPRRREYVDLVREVFGELTDVSTGERLIDDVVEIPEAFAGPRSHLLPDLVVTWLPRPQVRRVHSPLLGELSAEPSGARGGDHTDHGFALLSNGPASARSLPPLQGTADFAGVAQTLMET